MSINDRITSISTHLSDAYAEVSSKNGTVPSDKNLSNLAAAIRSIPTGGSPVVGEVQLNPPSLSLGTSTTTSDPLIITNSYNGNFVDYYDIYDGTTLLDTISASFTSNTINLRDYISSGTTHTIKVVAKGDGFLDSNVASIVYHYLSYATVTNNLTNCATNNSATTVTIGDSYQATLTADSGYSFVNASVTIMMNNVDVTSTVYNAGVINIANITGDIAIAATFAVITQLNVPNISLSGDILTIFAPANAESYILCLNGNDFREVYSTSVDLSSIFVISGTYSISAKAKAEGYLDSNASSSVSYTNTHGVTVNSTLENNDWTTIRLVCETGHASDYWSLGDTKTDLGTDGNTRTFRIVDMQGLYNKHVVFDQVEAEMNCRSYGYYDVSPLRLTHLPAIMIKYSDDLQNNLTSTSYITWVGGTDGGTGGSLQTLTDKLFVPAIKEISNSNTTGGVVGPLSNPDEFSALTTFQYFSDCGPGDNSKRVKKDNGTAVTWFLRSHKYGYSGVRAVSSGGDTGSGPSVLGYAYVAPCFSF